MSVVLVCGNVFDGNLRCPNQSSRDPRHGQSDCEHRAVGAATATPPPYPQTADGSHQNTRERRGPGERRYRPRGRMVPDHSLPVHLGVRVE